MSPAVPIREEDKKRLVELKAWVEQQTAEEVSDEEVLDRLITLGEKNLAFVAYQDQPPRLTEEEKQRILSFGRASGEPSDEEIDETLYGGPDGPA